MDFINSQHLTCQDGFVHPFRTVGIFSYMAAVADTGFAEGGTIKVEANNVAVGQGNQHDIVFRWDAAKMQFIPREDDMKLVIKQNDFVVFHFDQAIPGQPPCFITGYHGDKVEFDSRYLRDHEAFSHFFMAPGDYSYKVGSDVYRVSVTSHLQFSTEEHEQRARQAVVITINGRTPDIKHSRIVAGQTVIWAVEKGENVSIEVVAFEDPKPTHKDTYQRRA